MVVEAGHVPVFHVVGDLTELLSSKVFNVYSFMQVTAKYLVLVTSSLPGEKWVSENVRIPRLSSSFECSANFVPLSPVMVFLRSEGSGEKISCHVFRSV